MMTSKMMIHQVTINNGPSAKEKNNGKDHKA